MYLYISIYTDLKEIRFLPLGLNKVYLPSMDDGTSTSIPIAGGFPLGTSMQTSVYVSYVFAMFGCAPVWWFILQLYGCMINIT